MPVKLTAAVPLGLSAALMLAAPAARAALGGRYDSVALDRAHFAARLSSSQAATHTVHSLVLPNGGAVKEFTRADGTVFAVSWRGPGRPDLRQLLGPWFDAMQADVAKPAGPPHRRPLSVRRASLIVQSGGHPGAFWGMAMLPGLAPAGFTANDLN